MLLQDQHLNFLGIQEINLNFNTLSLTDQWKHRTANVSGYSHLATNLNIPSTATRLFGGTACFMPANTHQRAAWHGQDLTGLGRWCWTLLEGKRGIKTLIISAYCLASNNTNKLLIVVPQHLHYFESKDLRHCHPHTAFLDDLQAEMQQWHAASEQLILGMDVNKDVRSPALAKWLDNCNIVNAHTVLFPILPPVATCNKSRQEKPIDGIWVSPGITL